MEALSNFFSHLQKFTNTLRGDDTAHQPTRTYLQEAEHLAAFEENIRSGNTTYTEAITNTYAFNKKSTLVDITSHLAKQRFLEKDAPKRAQLQAQYDESKAAMKQARKFNKFAERVVSQESLRGNSHPLSGKNKDQGLQWTYGGNWQDGDNTDDSDKAAYEQGRGISLNRRFEAERLDPQHRVWGITLHSMQEALSPIYDAWATGQHENSHEDLTVAIELSDAQTKANLAKMNKYYTPQEAMEHIATSVNGELHDYQGNTIDTGTENYIFVMDMQGNLFVHPDDVKITEDGIEKRIGHPAFARGEAVACAGEMRITNGKIRSITNNSGHYCPQSYSLFRVASELHTRGVLADKCTVQSYSQEKLVFNRQNPAESTIKGEQIPAAVNVPDLSEKHNPLKLFNALTNVNLYLKERADETSFFGSYGRNYYARKEHFQSVLQKLGNGEHQEALRLIDEGIKKFDGMVFKGRYASCLEELKQSLTNKNGILELPQVTDRITAYNAVYASMNNFTSAVSDYHNGYGLMSDDSSTLGAISEQKIRYLAKRKEYADIKKEFFNDEDLKRTEYNNTVHR